MNTSGSKSTIHILTIFYDNKKISLDVTSGPLMNRESTIENNLKTIVNHFNSNGIYVEGYEEYGEQILPGSS
jgi:hypothetical protein